MSPVKIIKISRLTQGSPVNNQYYTSTIDWLLCEVLCSLLLMLPLMLFFSKAENNAKHNEASLAVRGESSACPK